MKATSLGLLLLGLLTRLVAHAATVTYDFTVELDGTSSSGSFSYSDSVIPPDGGSVSQLGLLSDFQFSWNGLSWDETTANTGALVFDSAGMLTAFWIGSNPGTGGCNLRPTPNICIKANEFIYSPENGVQLRGTTSYTPRGVLVAEPDALALPDLNSDGVGELAVLRGQPIRAEIRSGSDAALLGTVEFLTEGLVPLTVKALADSDGDGVAEIAVLARRSSDGRGLVEIRNVTGDPAARQVWFAANHQPVSLAVIEADADGNGVAELAVLSRRNSDGRGLVEVKNAYGATNPVSIWAGAGLGPKDLEVVNDADQNGVPEVAVLSSRNSDGRIVVEVKNAAGATNPSTVWFMAGNAAIDLTVVDDADGNSVPEVAVLSRRYTDGRLVAEVKNAFGPTNASAVWFMAGQVGFAIDALRDSDGNGVEELAVLSKRTSDGRLLVEVKNAAGSTNLRSLWYPVGHSARDLIVLPDLDGNGIDEVGVLMTRDSDQRILLQGRNASGSQSSRDYWFTP
jgi:hypothetical protein